jgi:hypothetical protein
MAPGSNDPPPRALRGTGLPGFMRARTNHDRRSRVVLWTLTSTALLVSVATLAWFWRASPPSSPLRSVELDIPSGAVASSSAPSAVPVVDVDLEHVSLDGVVVASTAELAKANRVMKVDGLFEALRARRLAAEGAGKVVLLRVASEVPAVVVKSVFQTAAFAGYPDVQFAVTPGAASAGSATTSARR